MSGFGSVLPHTVHLQAHEPPKPLSGHVLVGGGPVTLIPIGKPQEKSK